MTVSSIPMLMTRTVAEFLSYKHGSDKREDSGDSDIHLHNGGDISKQHNDELLPQVVELGIGLQQVSLFYEHGLASGGGAWR